MTKTTRLLVGAALIVSPTLISLAQLNVSPPATDTTPATATDPERHTKQATTVPSAKSVLQGLVNERASNPEQPVMPFINPDTTLTPAIAANAPKAPAATRRNDGDALQGVGRIIKDEKTSVSIFVFESDGTAMVDPPITLLPNSLLEAMEQSNAKSPHGAKFKIVGEITEYNGKNFLLIRRASEIKDLNQGIGG